MTLKQLSCFPQPATLYFPPPSHLTFIVPVYQHCLSESLLISCGWSRRGALSSSSSITSHVRCQGNHLTESKIKDSSNLVVFFFCLDQSHWNVLLHQTTCDNLFFHFFPKYLKAIFIVWDQRGKFDKLVLWKLAEVNAMKTICLCFLKEI